MAEETQEQEGSKTLVSFVVGLLIGGMLVWAFSGSSEAPATHDHDDHGAEHEHTMTEEPADDTNTTDTTDGATQGASAAAATLPNLPVGDGSIAVADQPAAAAVTLTSATYPIKEGWIGVREYNNGQLGYILGVVQFSEAAGLVPERVVLQNPTVAGRTYAVVLFKSDGVRGFNAAGDAQLDEIYATFTAQ